MSLRDALKPECIEVGSVVTTKATALSEVARVAKRCPALAGIDDGLLISALVDREKVGSTGIGNGLAIPHCRLAEVKEFVVGIITLSTPVDFGSIDNRPVKLLAFIIAPETMSEQHVVLLSQISQLLIGPTKVAEFAEAVDAVGLYQKVMAELGCRRADAKANWPASLFQVIVSNDNIFHEILPIFSAVAGCQAVVCDVSKATSFFRHMPLFASFWTAGSDDELRMLTAIVPKAMTNEVIRQIDQATGGIANRSDALLTVQDLFFCSGSLS